MSNVSVNCKRTLSSRLSNKLSEVKRVKLNPDVEINSSTNFDYNESINYNITNVPNDITNILQEIFYTKPCISLAQSLLGKMLVRRLDSGEILKGKIVETECYLGLLDKASHSYQGRRTERNEAMFERPGTAYVYSIYGMYYCFNISSQEEGSAVLLRAIEPLQGKNTMQQFRSKRRKNESTLKDKDLCNGPSKLCQAFQIEKRKFNKTYLCQSEHLWLEHGSDIPSSDIIACKRIGIDSAGEEWANKPLRYYMKDCAYVSIRNKLAEKLHMENVC